MTAQLEILYHGEARLADWGETRSGGKYIKLFLDDSEDDPLMNFRGLDIGHLKKTGHVFNVTISTGDIITMQSPPPKAKPTPTPGKPYGQMASRLFIHGFFIAPPVLRAIGTNNQFREWIETQPSAYSGDFTGTKDSKGWCTAASVKASCEGGSRSTIDYSAIPLTEDEYAKQLKYGETALMPVKDWERKRVKYITLWAKNKLAYYLGFDSIGNIPPKVIQKWCSNNKVTQYLPRVYRDG